MSKLKHFYYDAFMMPLEKLRLHDKRKQLLKDVSGDVLEVGYGTGVNLNYYPYEQMDSLTLVDQKIPDQFSIKKIPRDLVLSIMKGDVTRLPFEDASFDSIVVTFLFCTVVEPDKGVSELYRVLRPDGRLYFMEHVLPSARPYNQLFHKLTPVWKRVASNCHLNRETVMTIQHGGFRLVEYHRFFKTSFAFGIAKKGEFYDIQ
ncbi:MAG: methyltransferase domain-containing protein [Vallitaleaceae bacterium]|nr:methyltransferase domain-containing protein [Vallitaleaceae bacterium]